MSSLALVVALVALFSVSPASVQAQADDAHAAEEFALGEQAYSDERFAEALEHFQRAQSVAPHDVVRFNVAVCFQRLGRLRDAWLEYQALVRSPGLSEEEAALASRLAADLEPRLAFVRVTSSEPADAYLDGVMIGATPIETRVEPGPHVVSVRVAEREATQAITLERGRDDEVSLTLPPPLLPPEPVLVVVPTRRQLRDVGWLGILGGGLAAVGLGGTIGLGVHAQALFDAYSASPMRTLEAMREGELVVGLTNGAIGLASLGGVLIVVELTLVLTGDGSREVSVDAEPSEP